MILLDGKKLSEKVLNDVKLKVDSMSKKPHLVVILVGEDPASKIYVKNKNDDIRIAAHFPEIGGTGMANGDRTVCVKKQHCLGLADDIRAAYYNALLAANVNSASLKECHNARRGAGKEGIIADHDLAHVLGVEGVNVLLRIYSHNYFVLIKMLGERELTENSVYLLALVELVNERVKLFLSCIFGKLVGLGIESHLVARAFFIANVDLRRGVLANYNYSKSGAHTAFCDELFCCFLYLGSYSS